MAVAIIQDWIEQETDRSTANYDEVDRRLTERRVQPEGFVMHAAGFTGNGFRIIEIWDSREQWERFYEDHVLPMVREVAGSDERASAPELTVYELHNLIVPQRESVS
jgi:hypothetical protein